MAHGSIRRTVLRQIASAAVLGVMLTGAAILVYDAVVFPRSVVREYDTLSRMIAFHANAALVFDDADYARKILDGLSVEESVEEAVLEGADGRTLARYRRSPGASPVAEGTGPPRPDGHRFEGSLLHIARPVERDGETLGTLRIAARMDEIAARRRTQLVMFAGLLLASCLLVLPLSSRLSKVLVEPILGLARAAGRIGEGDLTTRVAVVQDDELGTLAAAFNEMTERLSTTTVSKDFLDEVFETMNDALIVSDGEGRIERVNRTGLELLGHADGELAGRTLSEFLLEHEAILEEARLHGTIEDRECLFVTRDREAIPTALSVAWMGKEAEGSRAAVLVARDIRERKEQERALVAAREAALEASRVKSQFLANVSHEMRTPMNGIIGMTELALETDLGPEQRGFLETVRSSSASLLRLIDDLLDLTSIEAGKLRLERAAFSPAELASAVARPLAFEAHRKGLELVVDVAPGTPGLALGDPGRLRQVLTNLLANAVKFTERGEVVLRVRAAGTGDSRARFLFSVEDTGIGVPAAKREEIFDVFAQADGSTTRRFGGAGLGLAISSRLVTAMGGALCLESAPGRGSEFFFQLPLELPARDDQSPDETPADLDGLSVLVVEDSASSASVLTQLLTRWGVSVRALSSLAEARSLLASVEGPKGLEGQASSFDVAMVDFDLVASGELEAELEPFRGAAREVVLLTSPGHPRFRNVEAPSVTKPVDPDELAAALRSMLSPESRTSESAPSPAAPRPTAPLRILVAEDNPVNCAVVKKTLSRRGHEVTSVADGRAAVARVEASSFDLVLMDIQMPEMDGLQATETIRERERASGRPRVPIVALTAHAMKGDRERCLEVGMDDYVSKPVEPAALIEIVERVARRAPASPPGVRPETDDGEVLDIEALMDRLGHDATLLEEIVRLYHEETPRLLEQTRHGIGSAPDEARRAAHRLRGMLSTMGANASAGVAERLEGRLEEGELDGAENLVEALAAALAELDRRLAGLDSARWEASV